MVSVIRRRGAGVRAMARASGARQLEGVELALGVQLKGVVLALRVQRRQRDSSSNNSSSMRCNSNSNND